jgi:hypothetical protein
MSYIMQNVETKEQFVVSSKPEWRRGVWECGDKRFTDPSQTVYAPLSAPTPVIRSAASAATATLTQPGTPATPDIVRAIKEAAK